MNRTQALGFLKDINRGDASIKNTAAYFSCYRAEAPEIAALFVNEIQNSPGGARKINLVYILHEIILTTLDMGDDFIKAFGDSMRVIVDSICSTHEAETMTEFINLLNLWEKRKFYTVKFMGKMRAVLNKKIDSYGLRISYKELKQGHKKTAHEVKGNRISLKDYNNIINDPVGNKIFILRKKEHSNEQKMQELKPTLSKLNSGSEKNKVELKIELNSHLPDLNDIVESCKDSIKAYSILYQQIASGMEEHIDELENPDFSMLEDYK